MAGVLFVGAAGPTGSGRSEVRTGPAAGWMVPRGISDWERELSFVPRASMTAELASALKATPPEAQIAPKRFPMARRAVDASPLLALSGNLAQEARDQGVRVHTVGVDCVSGDFYYFEEGGERPPLRVQGNLVEMLAPSLTGSSTNAEIATLLEGLIDCLLVSLSDGVVSELSVELADALPRLSETARAWSARTSMPSTRRPRRSRAARHAGRAPRAPSPRPSPRRRVKVSVRRACRSLARRVKRPSRPSPSRSAARP